MTTDAEPTEAVPNLGVANAAAPGGVEPAVPARLRPAAPGRLWPGPPESAESASGDSDERTWSAPPGRWQAPLLWRCALWLAGVLIPVHCRLRVTGDVPDEIRGGPIILAGNHISPFDPVAVTAACRKRRLAPRMMATGGLFRAPVIGTLMMAAGHISVDRGRDTVAKALPDTLSALAAGSVVFVYPEGRIGLDPAMWPERPKTGPARLALASRAPVVPVAIWGSHEVTAYHGWRPMLAMGFSTLWRRPTVRVHFGPPVDLSDLREGAIGHAQRASDRIITAIIAALAPLRADEPRLPRFRDHTRPISTARVYRRHHRLP